MTTDVVIPYVIYAGDGVQTRFTFSFPIIGTEDLYIFIDQSLMIEYTHYTVENLTDAGGDVVFATAPESGVEVLVQRKTTISQNVEYESFQKFPADTHEWNLDKLTKILQELGYGLLSDADGNPIPITFNLDARQNAESVTVLNSGGTNAELLPWDSPDLAGVYFGETTNSAPEDGAITEKADGYIWIEVAT